MVNLRDLIIVGAGPAGLAAALAADRVGACSTLIDASPRVGIPTSVSPTFSAGSSLFLSADEDRCAALRSEIDHLSARIELMTETTVRECLSENRVVVDGPHGEQTLEANQLIIATGAAEYLPPMSGWRLPGVMTPAEARSLLHRNGELRGKRVLVAGTGSHLVPFACRLHEAGANVVAVVEAIRRRRFLRHSVSLFNHRGLFRQGRRLLDRLRAANIPLHWGHVVTDAHGVDKLESVDIAHCDNRGEAIGPPTRLEIDALCLGFGFVPRTELLHSTGCAMRYVDTSGSWIADVDETYQTSVAGLRVAGDSGGFHGATISELQGILAGLAAARGLRCLSEDAYFMQIVGATGRLAESQRLRSALDKIYRVPQRVVSMMRTSSEQVAKQRTGGTAPDGDAA